MIRKSLLTPLAVVFMGFICGAHAQEPQPAPSTPAEPKTEPTNQPLAGIVKVSLETSKGTIELELDADKAPVTVQNFVNYVNKGHYTGTIFHRVIPGFMIQGGGFTADMQQKPTEKPIPCESKNGLKNARGTIAMARTKEPHSATGQFFINVKDNASLDFPSFDGWGYAVFGKVTKGMDVADAIVSVPTTVKNYHQDVPAEPIVISKASILP